MRGGSHYVENRLKLASIDRLHAVFSSFSLNGGGHPARNQSNR